MTPETDLAELQRHFVPPAGLNRSSPRDVRLTSTGRTVVVVALSLFASALVAGPLMMGAAIRTADDRQALDEHGIDMNAEVVGVHPRRGESRRADVAYRYVVDGQAYAGEVRLSENRWRTLRAGSSLPIRYMPTHPAQHHVAGSRTGGMPLWLPPVVSASLLAGALGCVLGLRAQRRLMSYGRSAPAIVRKDRKQRTSHGGSHRSITYEFPLMSGATATGTHAASAKVPSVGSVICVIYDPDPPHRSRPYPLPLVRPASL
jgi:hypothetical protein